MALAIVISGLTVSTALGSPMGAAIAAFGDWRLTMGFISLLAAAAGLGVWALLSHIPLPPAIGLAKRIAPVKDPRVALTLLTGLIYQAGHFIPYIYITVLLAPLLKANPALIGPALVLWGLGGFVANLVAGKLADSIGNRAVIVGGLTILAIDMVLLPVASTHLWSAGLAIAVWGAVAWGTLAPQQHRLVTAASHSPPVVLGLNTSGTYLGMTLSGVIGALALPYVGPHGLAYVAAALVILGLIVAELASSRINALRRQNQATAAV